MSERGDSFLPAMFREFYREVIRLKDIVTAGTWGAVGDEAGAAEAAQSQVAARVWQRLLSLLERQALAAGRNVGEYGAELYREAQYVMAALADEIFLNLEWPGRAAWRLNLLETKLFGSHAAGDLFFDKLEKLLERRDPVWTEVARVYLMALALGFQGRFRGLDDAGQLEHYREELFVFIYQRKPELRETSTQLLPQAYGHTFAEGATRRLPTARPWVLAILAALVLFGVASHVVWRSITDPLFAVTDTILAGK
jgi:type VI secretion system protein ImpK